MALAGVLDGVVQQGRNGLGFAAALRSGWGMGSTLTLGLVTLGALSLAPAGLPLPLFGSSTGAASGTVSATGSGEFSGISSA